MGIAQQLQLLVFWALITYRVEGNTGRTLEQDTQSELYMRNGMLHGAFGIPADAEFWANRFSLYDRYGNYRLAEGYQPPEGKLQGYAESVTSVTQLAPDPETLNQDYLANFWYSQSVPGGVAMSVPGRPWIRQAVPYSCETNPYKECPHETASECRSAGCESGRKVGRPIISPNGGEYDANVLVSIEVEGARMFPSTLPSAPFIPRTSFQNGVCNATCKGKPTWPACLHYLSPLDAVYGTEPQGGFLRSTLLENPCKSPNHLFRRAGYECRCNIERLECDDQDTFCSTKQRLCTSVEGKECTGIPEEDALTQACGPPEWGGICAFSTWYETETCVDDLTPIWPDANYQSEHEPTLSGSDCRHVVCTDHTQCMHIYYTLDGSEPTRHSRLYQGPFLLDTTFPVTNTVVQDQPFVFVTIKAIAVQEGNLDSDVTTSNVFYIADTVADTGIGRMWSWGHNTRGQLGLGDGLYGGDPRFPNDVPGAPTLIMPSFCYDPVTELLDPAQNCDPSRWVLTTPQANNFNARYLDAPDPTIVSIAAGAYHSLLITGKGKLMAWGWNGYGQLGNPVNMPTYGLPAHPADNTQRNLPTSAAFVDAEAEAETFVKIAAGTFHSAALDKGGRAYLWGNNFEGQLCSGGTVNINNPSRIVSGPVRDDGSEIAGARWVQVALGQEHTILLASTGQVYGCGSNRVYQLGRPRFTPDTGEGLLSSCLQTKTPEGCPTIYNVRWPRPLLVLGQDQPLERVVKIAAGAFHNLALTADGKVFAWGDNRMNQLGQGPLVNRGALCCAKWVPLYVDDTKADLQPDGGPGGLGEGMEEPAWAWEGYKVLDIAAGAHFSVAVVMNISGEGCTEDGVVTGHKCVRMNAKNGLIEQDWDIPRNVDVLSDHFRTDSFHFDTAPHCTCSAGLHLPGGLANCEDNAYGTLFPLGNGNCFHTASNRTYPCRYKAVGVCPDGTRCIGPGDCGGRYCDRVLRTCTADCPCADRSCPANINDAKPLLGDPVLLSDSWFRRAVKKGNTCGCTPGYQSEACRVWAMFGEEGALPDCCLNELPEAPFPRIKMDRAQWDAFNLEFSYSVGTYGTCTDLHCVRADPRACLEDNCNFPDHQSTAAGVTRPDDDHPIEIGHKQTCWCYDVNRCIGGNRPGNPCTEGNAALMCAGTPPGYCSKGGGAFFAAGGAAPIFWGDCTCRNATLDEWHSEHRYKGTFQNLSAPLPPGRTEPWAPPGSKLKITFWNSNTCPYHSGKQWAGPDCRLVKLPFPKFVFGWGDTRAGQLAATLTSTPPLEAPDDQPQNRPRPVLLESLSGLDMMTIAAGNFHAAVIVDPQPHDIAVCNLSNINPASDGAPPREGGLGAAAVRGMPFQCDGRVLYMWGGNTEGELGIGVVTPSEAVDCISVGNVRVPCENMGGYMIAQRNRNMIGRNISRVTLGYKHTTALLGDCPPTSRDRCKVCFGKNRRCVGCSGITNKPEVLDWCGMCDGDNSTCSGCQKEYQCTQDDRCEDKNGERIPCNPVVSYHPCHQGRTKGTPCCLDSRGFPATPQSSDPANQDQGTAPGNGPVPCSHFGTSGWRDRARASPNYCGLTYDVCDVCDGDHTRCLDCMAVNNGKQVDDVCEVCGGLATTCVGCDGQPEPNASLRATFDACENCGGDNSTCSLILLVRRSAAAEALSGVVV